MEFIVLPLQPVSYHCLLAGIGRHGTATLAAIGPKSNIGALLDSLIQLNAVACPDSKAMQHS